MSWDIIVVGGGPAGLSAALQARSRNKTVLVAGGAGRDGPLDRAERIDNYLGLPGLSGSELAARFRAHAEEAGTVFKKGRVLNIMPSGGKFYVGIDSDVEEAGAVVLATGVVRGRKYPGEAGLLGRGVSYCATCDGMLYRTQEVAVVGLSADAAEEANFLHSLGCRVTYVSPGKPEGLDGGIPVVKAAQIEILGAGSVSALRAGEVEIPCAGVFILRPSLAPADLLPGLALEGNYIAVDRNMATNVPGVFAAGDCTGLPLQVSKAVGEGLVAGHRAAEYLDKTAK